MRKLSTLEKLAVSSHAKQRMVEREISVDDVLSAISNGTIIKQYEDDKPLPSCLVLGKDLLSHPIHVVLSMDDAFIYIITAYHPDANIWSDDFRIKRS